MNENKYYIFQLIRKNTVIYYGLIDNPSNIEEKVKGYEYDTYNVLEQEFEGMVSAFEERARILNECIDNKGLPLHNTEYQTKTLYCSFCGKSQHEVKKLIAGPSVFICDECVDITVDIVDEDGGYLKEKALAAGGKDWFQKGIEFPPEFQQSGVTILSYFSEIVREKYPQDDIVVRIEQEGTTVRLVVQTPRGTKEVVERELEQYGMVVTGKNPPESLGLSVIETIKLKNELRLAQVRIESQAELLEHQRSQVDGLLALIRESLKVDAKTDINLTISPSIVSSPYQPTTIEQTAEGARAGDVTIKANVVSKYQEMISTLEEKYRSDLNIIDVIEALKKGEENGGLRNALKRLDDSPKKGKEFLDDLMQLGESIIVGAAGSGTWELLRSASMLLGV